jgi:hypothetical protein
MDEGSSSARPWRWAGPRAKAWLPLAALLVAIVAFYVFVVSAGHWTHWPSYLNYYDWLAEGFRSGHLHTSIKPSPALIAAANPYDTANVGLGVWDLSYYKGEYYLYWGPVPALLLALTKTVFRISSTVGDEYVVFALETIRLIAGALLIVVMARRLFPSVPRWLVATAIAVFGIVNPTSYTLARGGVYEGAIVGGQAFVTLGLLFALCALTARPAAPRRWLILAGVSWALALGCRVSLAPALALVTLATAFALTAGEGFGRARWIHLVRVLIAPAACLAAGVGLLLVYNKARFDSWVDFGLGRQISWMRYRGSPSYVAPNLYSYLLRPFSLACKFPFVGAETGIGERGFPKGYTLPRDYYAYEPTVGILNGTPWTWLAVGVAVVVVAWIVRRRRNGAAKSFPDPALFPARAWCAFSFGVLGTISMSAVMPEYMATMRFLNDAATGLILLATAGCFWLFELATPRALLRRLLAAGTVALAIPTLAIGIGLSFQGQYDHFKQYNPALLAKLTRELSVCRTPRAR